MPIPFVLASALALGSLESSTSAVDADATAAALRIRVGERASRWTIAVARGEGAQQVHVRLRRGGERELVHAFDLQGATTEERSRELAAALALVIEQHEAEAGEAVPGSTDAHDEPRVPPQGWLALGGRVSAGRPADAEGGLTLRAGATWGRAIVQPLALLGTIHARRDTLHVDGVRIGAGVALGHALPGTPLWLGGSVVPQAAWTLARGRGRASGWSSATELAVLAQLRAGAVLAALRLGIELAAPPLRASDRGTELRFGVVRFVFGLEIGVLLPPRARRR